MTFTTIRTRIMNYLLLTGSEAQTRIETGINEHYRRITSTLGLDTTRFVTRNANTTNGVATVTFTEIEKIDRILDTTDSDAIRLLDDTSIHEIRSTQPGTGDPTRWALQNTDADSVTVRLDTLPQTTYSLQADGWTTLADLSGFDEPVIPESFHDILVWYVISDELLKKEKLPLAQKYEQKAEKLLGELRFHLADSPTRSTRQGGGTASPVAGGGSGGSGTVGGTAYTQTALLTFDLGAATAPFAVAQSDAPYVANLGAEFLGNITTDRLIGRDTTGTGESEQLTVGGGIEFTGSGGIQTSALTGDVTKTAGGTATTIADEAVTYAKMQHVSAISKLLGRGSAAGAGDVEEITLGTGLSMSGTTLNASAGVDTTGTPANNQIAIFTDADTIEGDANLTWDGSTLGVTGAVTVSTTLGVTGATTLTGGVAGTLTLNGGQIAFPATQVPSADVNTLDDYQEGDWTPTDASGATLTFTTPTGHYVKSGQLVVATGELAYPSTVDGSSAVIGGLPFTSMTTAVSMWGGPVTFTNLGTAIAMSVASNATTASLVEFDGTSPTNAEMSTKQLRFVVIYRASA